MSASRTQFDPLECRGNYTATSNDVKFVHWPLMGGLLHWYSEVGTGRGRSPPRPLLAVPNATAHPSTASVPITILLYNNNNNNNNRISIPPLVVTSEAVDVNGLLLCGCINQSINQTRQFLTRRNTAKPLQGRVTCNMPTELILI